MTRAASSAPTLRFHARPGCTLCEKAWPIAQALARRHGLELLSGARAAGD